MPEGFTRTGLAAPISVTKCSPIGRRQPVLTGQIPGPGSKALAGLENSQGLVEIAVNRGNAAEKLNLEPGAEVEWTS